MIIALLFLTQRQNGWSDDFESYLAHIYSAQASLSMGDTALALRWLDKADPAHRGWEYDYLRAATDMSAWSRPLGRDASRIEFSSDGRRAAVANLDGTVTLFDGATMEPVGLLEGHTHQVWGLAFSSDGTKIATTSRDTTVRLWDVATRKEIATLGNHPTTPYSCAFSPDGKWVATPGWQTDPATRGPAGLISVWDVEKGALHKQWMVTTHPIAAVAFSPDGRYAAFGCWEYQTLIYDTRDWSLVREIWPEESETYKAVDWVQFSSDGTKLLAAHKDQAARLYDVVNGKLLAKYEGKGNATCARFSLDGKRVLTSWTDQNLRVFALDGSLLDTLRGHVNSVRCFALSGERIVSVGEERTLREWSLSAKPVTFNAGSSCWSAVPSPDGSLIATGSGGNMVRIWRPDGTHVRDLVGPAALVVDVSWSQDGEQLIGGSNDGTARIWRVRDGVERHVLRVGQTGQVRGVAWSPKGDMVSVGQGDRLVRWNPASGAKLGETVVPYGAYTVSISPDGEWIAVGGNAGKVIIVDAGDGTVARELQGGPSSVYEIAWTRDSRMIAASGSGGSIHLWSMADGSKLHESRAMTLDCWGLAFSPDGKRLAATGYDFTLRLFDVGTMQEVLRFRDLPGIGFDVHWSADGSRIIHTDTDGRVTVFDRTPVGLRP
jgi:WD40 repeat protein